MTAPTIEEWKKKYHMVDEIRFADEIEAYFAETQPDTIFLNLGVNSDSKQTTCIPDKKHFVNACPAA